jgi:lysophospholipase L1-like esterase
MPPRWLTVVVVAANLTLAPAADPAPTGDPLPVPAFARDARVLFQGDSITDGNRGRSADPNHVLGHGYAFVIGAKYGAAFPADRVTFLNRGVSGNTVADLAKRWQKDTLDLKPDVLSVLIGVNDHGRNVPLDDFERGYDQLLADARQVNPAVKLVLGEPFGLPTGPKKATWESWDAGMKDRRAVVARLGKKYDAAVARFQAALDRAAERAPAEHWVWDGVHPTTAGHQVLADEWVRAVREKWPESTK